MADPFPRGQVWRYTIRPDGTFGIRVRISAGFEMLRREGMVDLERGPEAGGGVERLVMRILSENGVEAPLEEQRFLYRWESDSIGEYLLLTGDPSPFEVYLRPVTPDAGGAGAGRDSSSAR